MTQKQRIVELHQPVAVSLVVLTFSPVEKATLNTNVNTAWDRNECIPVCRTSERKRSVPFEIESEHLGEVKIIVAKAFGDHRGYFMESYRKDAFTALGIPHEFLQDNHSRSVKGVVRGLHFQHTPPMAKLMRATVGTLFVVAVDIRRGSPTLGQWVGAELSAENKRQMWAPPGFARGFCVLSDVGELQYKCTATYSAAGEGGIRWNDPEIGIKWPTDDPILSKKDDEAPLLAEWLTTLAADHFAYKG
ncbi:MAG: dTDP-4-dehydrorhamnose 3,5-epimerase [Anaerolineae bacterium]|nr:dTDP-4-dehydrorhamnose 3,5-epimerase [Anaerolineae bacterium]